MATMSTARDGHVQSSETRARAFQTGPGGSGLYDGLGGAVLLPPPGHSGVLGARPSITATEKTDRGMGGPSRGHVLPPPLIVRFWDNIML